MGLRSALALTALAATVGTLAPAQPRLEVVAALDQAPGNVTLTPDGRIILSLHQMYAPSRQVVELLEDGSLAPFPDTEWNRPDGDPATRLDAVLGVQCDANGVVWMLDNGLRSRVTPKLVGWDTKGNTLSRVIPLPSPATRPGSFLNDLAVDPQNGTIYIADPATGPDAALIVVDVRSGGARRLLEGHPSVVPEDVDLAVGGRSVGFPLPDGRTVPVRVGVDPIALDQRGEWLYFGPLSGRAFYRIRAEDLRDASRSGRQLGALVERFAAKPQSDGSSMDAAGNIYVTDVGNSAIGIVTASGDWGRYVQDATLLSWPDALAYGPDGFMYVVSNQLHLSPPFHAGQDLSSPPYYLVRFRPLAPGVVGR